MDSESLDRCIQTALSALYPPFKATSPTILCQVLNVVESCYRGDGLRYLIHFLLPVKQLLANLQQDACLQYCGLLFRHEGWPLCVHEKVVVQLCPLDQRLLHPGDFYLSAVPSLPRLLLCSVSAGSRHVEQQEVSEIALRSLFSMAWLDSVNREREQRGAPRLERCLLSAHGDVFRVPWEDLVYPQFISRPQTFLEEDKKSSVKNGNMLLNTSHNSNASGRDVKLLPSSAKTDQSPASSEGEESEGEYVELTELPLPRFSPQKGSLTQSISLQHRARTSTPSAPVMTHTPKSTNTHSYWPCAEVSSHTGLCSKLINENLNQDSCGPVILAPVSSSSAPPEIVGTSRFQMERWTSQEQIEGTDSGRSLKINTEPANCTELREEEEEEEERGKQGETGEEREEGELMERQEGMDKMLVLADEGEEKEEQVEDTECRMDELLYTQTAEEEEEDECEHTEGELDEEGDDELEEVEVEEEVRVIIVQQSQERREEEQVTKEEQREGGEKKEEEERGGEQTHTDEKVDSCTNTHTEGSYSENNSQHTHCENSYSENNTQHVHCEELNQQHKHSEDSHSENNALQTHSEDSHSENNELQTHSEDSYSENNVLQTHSEDSYSENNALQTHSEDSHSENNALQTHSEDSHSENNELQTHSEDSYSENNVLQTHSEDSYSENNALQTHSEDSYSENNALQTHSEDSYSENNALQTHSEDSYSVNKALQTHSEDSYSENNALQTHSEDSYSENNVLQTHSEDSYSENNALQTHSEDSYSENKALQTHSEDSYSENNALQTHSEDSYSENNVLQTHSEDSYSENNALQTHSEESNTDRSGRALLTVCTGNVMWSNPDCDSATLLRLLLYYTSTLRKEARASGLTVLVDARSAAPVPALFSALRSLQNTALSIHSVLLLVNKDSSVRLDKPAVTQVEVLSSLKSLQKHVELRQLPAEFGGSLSFSQSSWLCFRSVMEQLTNQCENVINLLQKTINILQSTPLPAALLSRYKAVMRSILEDSRLVQLQQEGGASLSRLRREEGVSEDQRAAVETVASLYEEVDELLHRLVTLSNSRTQELHFILDFRSLEQGFTEVSSWLQEVGEARLKSLDEPEDSLELLNKKQQDFKQFHTAAYERCRRGEALLSRLERWGDVTSADLHVYEVKVHSFWAQLQDFSQRVNATGQKIDRTVGLYSFLDQAYGWALEGMRHLASVSMEECSLPDKCQAGIGYLEEYRRQHPPIPDARFQEMKAAAGELRGERGLRQWSFAWSKCQETKKMFDRKMEAALRTRSSTHRQRSDSTCSRSSTSSRRSLSGLWGVETSSSPPQGDISLPPNASSPLTSSPLSPHTSSEESSDRVDICSSSPSLPRLGSSSSSTSFFSSSRRQQLRKTQSFDCPSTPEVPRYGPCPRALSEPARRGNTGVFIRGLEISSTEAADLTLSPRTAAPGWAAQGLHSPLRHVVEEMVTTEREYVRSLRYILHHYFPEMDRVDLPQDLRGKRSVVFGNLEKLLDFHSQFFLRELESCWKHPLRVPHCFLRHQEQFSLYALYSKNKPKSDALLANHGNSFFRRKQVELGDKMDLSSYLLKPVQRMSKYALLLTDLMKEVGAAQEAELVTLQAATDMVKFQLRHGNDLLAMDAIRDCDVNLKEQGQLIRQDEFTVWSGRRKCQRHVFLFEELVLFSKPRKVEGGLDVFIYKHSFKTADVGLTESTGDNGLRFEIWFRRRTSKNQTFILQAATADVKHAWTADIARILWNQATRNKEMRLKEMVSMGVGNKPFLDIQPSDAAISDRAVHYIMKSRGARTRASIAVSVFDHSNPFQRGAVTSDPATSGPSSSSLLGPLNLHMYSQTLPSSPAAESSFITSCIEEDEQEHETSSQPSMST
uniref:Pleckstrin homology domain containing, family G (with RhoGef domain) member 4 n=1 Tax=Dicentrarchus labrax TaxID=13489 RepID=A0A8P4GGS4_DICLA